MAKAQGPNVMWIMALTQAKKAVNLAVIVTSANIVV
jgi:hypothetical protein